MTVTRIRRVAAGAVPVALICAAALAANDASPKILVIFRFDDPSSISNTAVEDRVFSAFARHGAKLAIGAVPYPSLDDTETPNRHPDKLVPLTDEKAKFLRSYIDQGVLEIGLHGYSHQTWRLPPLTEFKGLPYEEQLEKLQRGQRLLEERLGIKPRLFVPPWNRIDSQTVDAAAACGLSIISADALRGAVGDNQGVKYLPQTCFLWQIKEAVEQARQVPKEPVVVVALFHEYDFYESKSPKASLDLSQLDDLLKWLSEQPDARAATFEEVASALADCGADRFAAFQRAVQLPAWTLRGLASTPLTYLQALDSNQHVILAQRYTIMALAAATGLMGMTGWMVGVRMYRRAGYWSKRVGNGSLVALLGIVGYSLRDGSMGGNGLLISLGCLGGWLGYALSGLRNKTLSRSTGHEALER